MAPYSTYRKDPLLEPVEPPKASAQPLRGEPGWTRGKVTGLVLTSLVVLLLLGVRAGVDLCGKDCGAPAVLGLHWTETTNTAGGAHLRQGQWVWPELRLLSGTALQITVHADVMADMTAFAALGVLLAIAYGMAGLQEVPRRRYLRRGVQAALLGAVLAYTYHWCGIDPFGVWRSKSNAWTHLAGRSFSDQEIADIRADSERAPDYYAEGEANYIISQKYAATPADRTPSVFAKQKEVRLEKEKVLAQLTPEKRAHIVEAEYLRLLDKKRGGYWPPELAPSRVWMYFSALMETIAIAIWASLLAVLCAIPLSVLAARNTLELIAPGENRTSGTIRWLAVFVVRRFLDFCRGFNELVMALIFVSVIGLGPFAGILALWVHTTGVLGKVFSEAIEAIDAGQVEALVGSGAGSTQTISFAVLPQVLPTIISYSLLRFESNVRSAAILGWVGAGGIGFLLQDKMVGYSHREVCTMMIMIIVAVSLIDFFCGRLRRRFI